MTLALHSSRHPDRSDKAGYSTTHEGGGRPRGLSVLGEAGEAPPLKPTWRGQGCWQCDKFNDGWAQMPESG